MIGLIIPPADIKKLLEKTAEHVATNGLAFEKVLVDREQHKPEFAFLKTDSPYRPYYDHRVAEISKQLLQGLANEESKQAVEEVQEEVKPKIEERGNSEQQALLQKIFVEMKEPDPEKYIAEIPQKLLEAEEAIIQHTAQYCSKNGKNFLSALSERQKNNPQFQFLKNNSKHHSYFLTLVQAYTHILQMSQDQYQKLVNYSEKGQAVLQKCRQTFEYHLNRQQQLRGRKQQPKQVKESNIDWNDFELVETISFEYQSGRNMGGELLQRIQQQQGVPKNLEETVISVAKSKEILQQCHVCRQNILASEMNKHLKTCLGQKKKGNNDGNANRGEQVDIRQHLQGMSARRPDIFGKQDNQIQLKEGPQEQKVIFDGQSTSMTRATGSYAMLVHQQKKLREEQERQSK